MMCKEGVLGGVHMLCMSRAHVGYVQKVGMLKWSVCVQGSVSGECFYRDCVWWGLMWARLLW